MTEERQQPAPLQDVRQLPFGEYRVRAVHLEQRGMSFGSEDVARYAMENVPHVVLQIGPRTYVIDSAQQFKIGSVRGPAPETFKYYRLHVQPFTERTGIPEDATRRAAASYSLEEQQVFSVFKLGPVNATETSEPEP